MKLWSLPLAAAASLLVAGTACAQEWPSKPVRFIATFGAGGAADLTPRIIGERLSDLWKQQVVVENRGGGNGNVGVEAAMRSPADGYTVLVLANTHVINMALYPKLPYDLTRDFVHAVMVTSAPLALVANPRVKASNIVEMTQEFRARPGKIDVVTCGIATAHHFAMEIYKHSTRTFSVHIPQRSCAGAVTDVVSGTVDLAMVSLPAALPFIKQGKLKPIGITSKERSPNAPDIPTFHESKMKELVNFDISNYYGFSFPAGTPKEIVAKLEADTRKVMGSPELKARLAGAGLDPYILGQQQTLEVIRADVEKFRQAIKIANIQPE